MLVPYNRKNHSVYNPFQDFDDLERAFFSDRSLGELKTDIKDTGDSYTLEADLPGFNKGDIDLHLQDGVLTITAKHQETSEKKEEGKYLCRERRCGSYQRSFDVSGIQEENITAAYDNGVLKLTLPKQGEVIPQSRKIAIE